MGGKAFPNVGRINKEQIPKTLEYLSDITEIALDYLQDNLLGSAGKKSTSGDIDIALGAMWSMDQIEDELRLYLGKDNVKRLPAMNILSCAVPIEGNKENGFIQVDFMFTDNLPWTKFSFYSDGDKSQYSGVHRSLFLSALAAFKMQNAYTDQILTSSFGYVWSPAKGLSLVFKNRRKNEKTGEYLKTMDTEHTGNYITDPIDVTNYLITNHRGDVKPEDLASVEKIYNVVLNNFNEDYIKKILSIYRERLESTGNDIPSFMQESD